MSGNDSFKLRGVFMCEDHYEWNVERFVSEYDDQLEEAGEMAIEIQIGEILNACVIMNFSHLISSLTLTTDEARAIAASLVHHADEIDRHQAQYHRPQIK